MVSELSFLLVGCLAMTGQYTQIKSLFIDPVNELVFFSLFTLGNGTGHSVAINLVVMKITSDVFSFAVQYLLMFHCCPVPIMANKEQFLLALPFCWMFLTNNIPLFYCQ